TEENETQTFLNLHSEDNDPLFLHAKDSEQTATNKRHCTDEPVLERQDKEMTSLCNTEKAPKKSGQEQ
ncbi:17383_t:CDS:1, partial [Racocetra fulgida]